MNRYNSRFISLNLDHITLQCLKKPYTFLERDSSLEMKSELIFITTANKEEINILSARDTTRPGPWARASWVMMQWYIRESIARGVHLGLRTNRSPLADDKFSLV